MDKGTLLALSNVVRYLWEIEQADYDEQDDEDKAGHIYCDLVILDSYLDRVGGYGE